MWAKSSFTIPAVAAISSCIIGGASTAPAYADLGDQLFKLVAKDAGAFDSFGRSAAISGTTAIIGGSGLSAYLFDTTTGDQRFKLLPRDEGGFFGSSDGSVAISGTIAIVGDWGDEDNGASAGSAYLFDTTTGEQLFKLLAKDGASDDRFGWSVAISGDTAIIGAERDDDSGSAYLFDISDPANPTQLCKLLPTDGAADDRFGASVAISGSPGNELAIVGAPHHDANDNFDNNAGSAYLFDVTTGLQLYKLLPDDGAASDRFGNSVAISGTTAIVGAWRNDDACPKDPNCDSGSAYLFDTTTGKQIFKLLPDDGAELDQFGGSVGISGTTAIVGANTHDDNGFNSGATYLFDTTKGLQLFKLLPKDGAPEDDFGSSVAISGDTAIVGASGDDDNGESSGSAYLFDAGVPGMCPWDLDANGSVGASDLLALLVSWGPCKGCPADFDGSGSVGASDLLALLANWGPCR